MKELIIPLFIILSLNLAGQPVDPEATQETVNLFNNLKNVAKGSLLFGHEDALAYGLNSDGSRWIDEENRSDVKSITGSHPAVYGWDIGRLELVDSSANIDNVNFERMKFWIRTGYERGGIITISWHSNNPQTGGSAWDTEGNAPSHVIPGGDKHELYKEWLDRFAEFLLDLKDSSGSFIPILFRPYHEHMGSWFWWGRSSCSVEEYITLWRFTVEYLRDEKHIHHLLYAYSPNDVSSEEQYLERYPGDEYVDLLGTDDYYNVKSASRRSSFLKNLRITVNLANEKGKIAALTETGNEGIPDDDWFTTIIVDPIKEDSIARQLAYFLVWRNGRPDHYFAPYPGHPAADDLVAIHEQPFVQFENDLKDLYQESEISIIQQLPDYNLEAGSEVEHTISLDKYFFGASRYDICYASNEDIIDFQIDGSDLVLSPTTTAGKGEYRVKAISDNQSIEMMFMIEVESTMILNLEESTESTSLAIFPNPTKDFLKIKNGDSYLSFIIYSNDGRILRNSKIHNDVIDVSSLTNGIYYLGIFNEDSVIVRRFIKN